MAIKKIDILDMLDSLPAELATEPMKEAVVDWFNSRLEICKPITPTAWKRQLNTLKSLGHDAALAALNHSIGGGYQGIFPDPKFKPAGKSQPDRHQTTASKVFECQSRIKAKERLVAQMFAQYRFDYPENRSRHPSEYEEYKRLRSEIQELTNEVARLS